MLAAAILSFNNEHLQEKLKVKKNHVESRLHILYKDVIFSMAT